MRGIRVLTLSLVLAGVLMVGTAVGVAQAEPSTLQLMACPAPEIRVFQDADGWLFIEPSILCEDYSLGAEWSIQIADGGFDPLHVAIAADPKGMPVTKWRFPDDEKLLLKVWFGTDPSLGITEYQSPVSSFYVMH